MLKKEVNSLINRLLLLALVELLRHIKPVKVTRVPGLTSFEHVINGGKDHSGYGDDSAFSITFLPLFVFVNLFAFWVTLLTNHDMYIIICT